MDTNDIQRLAVMGSALRPDWPAKSLQTFIEKNLANRTYGDTAVALAWICTRTKTHTPRLLLESGAWWKATTVDTDAAPRPPKRDEACATCGRRENSHDDVFLEHHFRPMGTAARDRAADKAALARAELAQATANHCSHNVPLKFCKAHEVRHDTAHTTAREQGTEQEEQADE